MCVSKFLFFMCITSLLYASGAYKILVVFPFPSGSHCNLGDGYVRHLLKAGHEVTYITPFPKNNPNPKLRQINVGDNANAINAEALNAASLIKQDILMNQELLSHIALNVTKNTLTNAAVIKLLNDPSEHFDVVIAEWIFNEIYSGFSAVFNCPYIWFFPYEPNFVGLALIDETTNPAYTANIQFSDIPPFTLNQRVFALWFQITYIIKDMLFYKPVHKDFYAKTFDPILAKQGRKLPPYEDIIHNASLMLGNSHFSIGQAIRLPQSYVPIIGYHIDDTQTLPEDLKQIMDNSKDGVIYFSLGTNLKSKDLPEEVKTELLNVFSGFKQTVIWKFEEALQNTPKNVHILKWAPQTSILAHPNCVLFITHGGLLSTTEAVHFGVPFIGIPVFFDQNFNVDQSVKRGIALKINLNQHGAKDMEKAVYEILNNPKYRQKMKEISFIYHNRPLPPEKELVHWVEYVIRTKGSSYQRSPALLMPWYQKMYLDLAALICILVSLFAYTVIKMLRLACKTRSNKKIS